MRMFWHTDLTTEAVRLEQVTVSLTMKLYLVLLLGSILNKQQVGWSHQFDLVPTVLAEGYSASRGRPFHWTWTSERCFPGKGHLDTNAQTLLLAVSPNCCFAMIHQSLAETKSSVWQRIRTHKVNCRKSVAPIMHLDFEVVGDIPHPDPPQLQSYCLPLPADVLPP